MKQHHRVPQVRAAETSIGMELLKIREQYGLTPCEFLQILNREIATELSGVLRKERHPNDPGCPADAAEDDEPL